MPTPDQKIRILEGSVRCLSFGFLSLIPILGASFALAAFRERRAVKLLSVENWNPAQRQLRWGTTLACVGTCLTLGVVLFVLAALVDPAP